MHYYIVESEDDNDLMVCPFAPYYYTCVYNGDRTRARHTLFICRSLIRLLKLVKTCMEKKAAVQCTLQCITAKFKTRLSFRFTNYQVPLLRNNIANLMML